MRYHEIHDDWQFVTVRRTILDADIIGFAGLSGDFNPLHIDDEAAREQGYERRIAHGMLVASIVTGLRSPFDSIELVAFLETTRRFLAPVYTGDTIWAEYRVQSRRLSSKDPSRGVVAFEIVTKKTGDVVVQTGVDTCLVVA
jgi:acyl dehydratase